MSMVWRVTSLVGAGSYGASSTFVGNAPIELQDSRLDRSTSPSSAKTPILQPRSSRGHGEDNLSTLGMCLSMADRGDPLGMFGRGVVMETPCLIVGIDRWCAELASRAIRRLRIRSIAAGTQMEPTTVP